MFLVLEGMAGRSEEQLEDEIKIHTLEQNTLEEIASMKDLLQHYR